MGAVINHKVPWVDGISRID